MSVTRFVSATQGLNTATGVPIPPPAGATVVADGAGGATWGAGDAAPTVLTVYVSTTGNDANNGATPATAVATIPAAIAIVQRRGWQMSAAIRILPGAYVMAGGAVIRSDGAPGARAQLLTIRGDSVTSLGSFSVLAAAVVDNLVQVTIASPVPLAADGQRARFTSGGLAGMQYVVGNIVGATFTLMGGVAPAPGDTFELEATNVTISFMNGVMFSGAPRVLQDVSVVLPPVTATPPALLLLDTALILSGACFAPASPAGGIILAVQSTVSSGAGDQGIPGVPPNPMGMALLGTSGGPPNLNMLFLGGSFISFGGCYVRDADLQVFGGASQIMGTTRCERCRLAAGAGGNWSGDNSQYADGPSNGLDISNGRANLSNVDISNCAGAGVTVASGDLRIEQPVTSSAPNGDAGVRIGQQGRVAVANNGAGVTVTGGTGDVVVGTNAPATWADLVAGIAARTDFAAPLTVVASIAIS